MCLRRVVLILALSLTSVVTPAYAREPNATDYFIANGDYLDLKISPDGLHLAALVRGEGAYALMFLRAATLEVVGGLKLSGGDMIYNYQWANNDRVVFEVAQWSPGREQPSGTGELYGVDSDGSRLKVLFGRRAQDQNRGNRITKRERAFASHELVSLLPDDPKHVLIVEYPWELRGNFYIDSRTTFPIVSKLNIYNGRRKKREVLSHRGATARTDSSGQVMFIAWNDDAGIYHGALRSFDDKGKPLGWDESSALPEDVEKPWVLAMDSKAKTVYVGGESGDRLLDTVWRVDLQAGRADVLIDNLEADISSVLRDPKSGAPIGLTTIPNQPEYHYLDPSHALVKLHAGLRQSFDGQLVNFVSASGDGTQIVVHVRSDRNPGEFLLFDVDNKTARFIFANRSWMDPNALARTTTLQITARDGVKVPVLLTMPPEPTASVVPMIVYSHGGPHGIRSSWEFKEEVQLLAHHGFAVVEVNFRGSGGYGGRFLEYGYGEWGGKMIDDIEDAVEQLRASRPNQFGSACAYGASFGAYASVALATRQSDWLACAAGFAGVYDLTALYTRGDIADFIGGEAYLERAIGADDAKLEAFSPVGHADQIIVPVLLVHGEKDRRAPVYHAEQMAKALLEANRDVELVVEPSFGHGIFSEKERARHYERLIAFFDQNLK